MTTRIVSGLLLGAIDLIPPQFHPSLRLSCSTARLASATPKQVTECGVVVQAFAAAIGSLPPLELVASVASACDAILAVNPLKLVSARARLDSYLAENTSMGKSAVASLFKLARSTPSSDRWPFWEVLVFDPAVPVGTNVEHLQRAERRVVILETLREICPSIEQQLADPSIVQTPGSTQLGRLCVEGKLSLRNLVEVMGAWELGNTDSMSFQGKRLYVKDKFVGRFMDSATYSGLVEMRKQVVEIPIEFLFEKKLECLGTVNIEACRQALQSEIPELYPHVPYVRRAQAVRFERLRVFGLRLRRLLASELGPEFVQQMRHMFEGVSGTERVAGRLDRMQELLSLPSLAGYPGIIHEFRTVEDLLPIFVLLHKKPTWNFDACVMNSFLRAEEEGEPSEALFMEFMLAQTRDALLAIPRKSILHAFRRACDVYVLDSASNDLTAAIRQICERPRLHKVVKLLRDFRLMEAVDALVLGNNQTGVQDAVIDFFRNAGLQPKPQHVQIATELPEDKDARTCMICYEEIRTLSDFRFLCAGKSQCCRTCIQRWAQEKGAAATCPNCREDLGPVF